MTNNDPGIVKEKTNWSLQTTHPCQRLATFWTKGAETWPNKVSQNSSEDM